MARLRPTIIAALADMFGDGLVFDMDEEASARLEGFSAALGWARRSGPRSVRVNEGGVTFEVTIGVGHKTGLYLDQRENRARVGALARGRDVLDAFSYTAGFACHALHGGARRAVCIEYGAGGDPRVECLRRASRARARRGALRGDRPRSAVLRP
ncbi:MAG: hypothetical protein DMD99_23585 [Candidatus Rokuibacteriota bacterium]|nr:MAG: hypothetical protein DMD99_23585 [Candidatus Rokubacteria bacterium]